MYQVTCSTVHSQRAQKEHLAQGQLIHPVTSEYAMTGIKIWQSFLYKFELENIKRIHSYLQELKLTCFNNEKEKEAREGMIKFEVEGAESLRKERKEWRW